MRLIKKLFAKKGQVTDSAKSPAPRLFMCDFCYGLFAEAFQRMNWSYTTETACEECRDDIVERETEEEMMNRSELGVTPNTLDYHGTEEEISEKFLDWWKPAQHPKPAPDYSDEPQVWGFMLAHIRATDRVYFGPFRTRQELSDWMEEVGRRHGISGAVYPLMNPQGDPADFWWIPDGMPWEETLKPKKERDYIP